MKKILMFAMTSLIVLSSCKKATTSPTTNNNNSKILGTWVCSDTSHKGLSYQSIIVYTNTFKNDNTVMVNHVLNGTTTLMNSLLTYSYDDNTKKLTIAGGIDTLVWVSPTKYIIHANTSDQKIYIKE